MLTDPTSPLIVAAERALRAEFPTQAQARVVLSVIGSGERAFSAMQSRTGLPGRVTRRCTCSQNGASWSGDCRTRAGREASSRAGAVVDPYMRFWLRFVEPSIELVERGRGALALELVQRDWNSYPRPRDRAARARIASSSCCPTSASGTHATPARSGHATTACSSSPGRRSNGFGSERGRLRRLDQVARRCAVRSHGRRRARDGTRSRAADRRRDQARRRLARPLQRRRGADVKLSARDLLAAWRAGPR